MDNKREIEAIIHKIMLRHIGSANAIKSAQIAQIIGNHFEDATHQGTRTAIRECLESSCIPIGSNSRGYFLISTEEEFEEYMESLRHRITGIWKRIKLVETAWTNKREYRQISLEDFYERTDDKKRSDSSLRKGAVVYGRKQKTRRH